jgi:hypothetical protein
MAVRNYERLQSLIKVQLKHQDSFIKIKSLLRRIGINPKGTNKLFQTCHILRDGNSFYICHFKELFWVDGKENHMSQFDVERRNKIITILHEKKLIDVDINSLHFSKKASRSVFIVPFAYVESWELHSKYKFRKTKRISPENGTIN